MKTFSCACGARTFFENHLCLACSRSLGFIPTEGVLSALEPLADGRYEALAVPGLVVRKCQNNVAENVCNWMVVDDDTFCQACRLNNVIPDLSNAENRRRWAEVENAKRQLVYSLNRLGLPIVPKSVDAERGVAFDILATTPTRHVITGHEEGLITLNVAEADPVTRERTRVAMNERYRTVLGHFRHEIGHYYWDVFFGAGGTTNVEAFRAVFGDERADYRAALDAYYANGVSAQWPESSVSAYATSHPWEDWAESFAHYLHVMDTLETARHFGLSKDERAWRRARDGADFDGCLSSWIELTIALNALNRSMGLPDAYPFPLSQRARTKLAFVHACVRAACGTNDQREAGVSELYA